MSTESGGCRRLSPQSLREFISVSRHSVRFVLENRPVTFLLVAIRSLLFMKVRLQRDEAIIPWAHCGFFANLRAIVFLLHGAEQRGVRPVIVSSRYAVIGIWPLRIERNLYWDDAGWNGSHNTWEYYFEPISGESFERERIWIRDPRIAYDNPGFTAQDNEVLQNFSRYGYTSSRWAKLHGRQDYPTPEDRATHHALLTKYVRVKHGIMAKVDAFYARQMARGTVVGVHIRKGDFEGKEGIGTSVEEFVRAVTICPGWEYVYLATDCNKTLREMRRVYGNRLLSYDCFRADDRSGIHYRTDPALSKPRLGEEVLIDALLLSRCNWYVHGNSSMNFAVLSWNPHMEHINIFDLRQEC